MDIRCAHRGFSLLEFLVSIAIIALLLAMMLPLLSHARSVSHTTLCAGNLKQIGTAWQTYVIEHDRFPRHTNNPDWYFGGAAFVGVDRQPILDMARPINKHLTDDPQAASRELALLFRCPADRGVFVRGSRPGQNRSSASGGRSVFDQYGTSYRANPYLLDSTMAGVDFFGRALFASEVNAGTSTLLLTADATWYYATRPTTDPQSGHEASWHVKLDFGNMLALDGSVRYLNFGFREAAIVGDPGGKPTPPSATMAQGQQFILAPQLR